MRLKQFGTRRKVEKDIMSEEQLWLELNAIAHERDAPLPESWKTNYWTLYQLVRQLRPRTICEIGVRAGYSAYVMLRANPTASVLGIEANFDEAVQATSGGKKDFYKHALSTLADYDFDVILADSHSLARIPAVDLVYVDGDHSREGCFRDLDLAFKSNDRVLVHDVTHIRAVQQACDDYVAAHPQLAATLIESPPFGYMLIERKPIRTCTRRQRL